MEEKTCTACGEAFKRSTKECASCIWKSLPEEIRRSVCASMNNARRARQRGAEVTGPISRETYMDIRTSGPCAYCAGEAETVDHVRPLSHGGWEHESNLVPACKSCNFSKGPRLLVEWGRADRVAYGVEHSPKVAAEYDRLTGGYIKALSWL
jgi:5-methylcytosine-specific restriction endonuclease McrA